MRFRSFASRGRPLQVVFIAVLAFLLMPTIALAATEEAKQAAIDKGLAYLASSQTGDGSWRDYSSSDYWVPGTASAALAFIEKGYKPGVDVIIGGTNYGDVVGKAVSYIDQYAAAQGGGTYWNSASGSASRSVYTTGVVTPVYYALGNMAGNTKDSVHTSTNALLNGRSYKNIMGDVMDWYTFGQNMDGGWRYYANYGASDNSTAQWGALPYLYGESWGIPTPAIVKTGDAGATTLGLEAWTNQVQNTVAGSWQQGGSGYTNQTDYVNMAKTGGLLLEFAVLDKPVGDADVQAALGYMQSMVGFDHWNQGYHYSGSQWYGGNLMNPYAMWAVYKGLEQYGFLTTHADGYEIGTGIGTAPGGYTIGFAADPKISSAGDWYSHYCDLLVNSQAGSGDWGDATPWGGAMVNGWYINILNATGAPPPDPVVPEPATIALLSFGVAGLAVVRRRRRRM